MCGTESPLGGSLPAATFNAAENEVGEVEGESVAGRRQAPERERGRAKEREGDRERGSEKKKEWTRDGIIWVLSMLSLLLLLLVG